MIRLFKEEIPAWLREHQVAKTIEYKNAPKGNKPSPWRAPEIVSALKRECSKKCMYCEVIVDDGSYSAIEHILPKDKFEDLVLEWDNLGLVCPRCNTNKSNYWTSNPNLQILNPYKDEVDNHLDFRGPIVVAKIGSTRGENTLRKLKFTSRKDLFFSRMKRIEEVDNKIRNWAKETNPEIKSLYAEDVEEAIARDKEFSAILRAYAVSFDFPVT